DDAGIAAGPRDHARADLLEQALHGVLVGQIREGQPAVMDRRAAGQGDQLLGVGPNGPGAGLGGGDAVMPEQAGDQRAVEGRASIGGAGGLAAGALVSRSFSSSSCASRSPSELLEDCNRGLLRASASSPDAARRSRSSSSDFLPKLRTESSSSSDISRTSPT